MTNAKKVLVALLTVLLLASSLGFSLGGSSAETRYNQAINLLQEGKFSEAAPIFQELGYYQDAGQYAMYCSALAEAEQQQAYQHNLAVRHRTRTFFNIKNTLLSWLVAMKKARTLPWQRMRRSIAGSLPSFTGNLPSGDT